MTRADPLDGGITTPTTSAARSSARLELGSALTSTLGIRMSPRGAFLSHVLAHNLADEKNTCSENDASITICPIDEPGFPAECTTVSVQYISSGTPENSPGHHRLSSSSSLSTLAAYSQSTGLPSLTIASWSSYSTSRTSLISTSSITYTHTVTPSELPSESAKTGPPSGTTSGAFSTPQTLEKTSMLRSTTTVSAMRQTNTTPPSSRAKRLVLPLILGVACALLFLILLVILVLYARRRWRASLAAQRLVIGERVSLIYHERNRHFIAQRCERVFTSSRLRRREIWTCGRRSNVGPWLAGSSYRSIRGYMFCRNSKRSSACIVSLWLLVHGYITAGMQIKTLYVNPNTTPDCTPTVTEASVMEDHMSELISLPSGELQCVESSQDPEEDETPQVPHSLPVYACRRPALRLSTSANATQTRPLGPRPPLLSYAQLYCGQDSGTDERALHTRHAEDGGLRLAGGPRWEEDGSSDPGSAISYEKVRRSASTSDSKTLLPPPYQER